MTKGNGDSWQPVKGADPDRIRLLGTLLKLRRADLGYRRMPAFIRDRDINIRMIGDIEHGRRDTFESPSLKNAARAYEVTYESMLDVVWSDAGELVPVAAGPARPALARHDGPGPGGVPPGPFDDPGAEADYPYAARIWQRFVDVAGEGVAVTGALMFPDAPDDAKAWDGIGSRLPVENRVWFIARLQRREADRRRHVAGSAGSEANGTGA